MSDEKEQTVTIPVSEYLELLKHKSDGKSSLAGTPGSAWIATADRFPANGEYVIHAYADCRPMMIGRHSCGQFFDGNGPGCYPTKHWMPLPPPPNISSQRTRPDVTDNHNPPAPAREPRPGSV